MNIKDHYHRWGRCSLPVFLCWVSTRKWGAVDPVAFDDLSKVIQELKDTRHFYDSYMKDYEDGIAEISFVHRLRNSLAHNGNNDLRFFPIGEGNQEVSRIKSIINN